MRDTSVLTAERGSGVGECPPVIVMELPAELQCIKSRGATKDPFRPTSGVSKR